MPDEVLERLVDLLHLWGIREKDWALATHFAFQRCGYYMVDKRNPREIDVIINKFVLPWRTEKLEWTGIPPRGSRFKRDFINFQNTTRCPLHLITFPLGPWKIRQITSPHRYHLPSGKSIMIHPPYLAVRARTQMLVDKVMREDFHNRIQRWSAEHRWLYDKARLRNDQPLIKSCKAYFGIVATLMKKNIDTNDTNGELRGVGMGMGIISGTVRVVRNKKQFYAFKNREILVAEDTNPIYLPLMKKARVVITDRGGVTSHAATLAREFGIPAVIGTKVATKVLKTGDRVEVNTKTGTVKKL